MSRAALTLFALLSLSSARPGPGPLRRSADTSVESAYSNTPTGQGHPSSPLMTPTPTPITPSTAATGSDNSRVGAKFASEFWSMGSVYNTQTPKDQSSWVSALVGAVASYDDAIIPTPGMSPVITPALASAACIPVGAGATTNTLATRVSPGVTSPGAVVPCPDMKPHKNSLFGNPYVPSTGIPATPSSTPSSKTNTGTSPSPGSSTPQTPTAYPTPLPNTGSPTDDDKTSLATGTDAPSTATADAGSSAADTNAMTTNTGPVTSDKEPTPTKALSSPVTTANS